MFLKRCWLVMIMLASVTAHASPPTKEVRALVDWAVTHPEGKDLDQVLMPFSVIVQPRGAITHTLAKRFDVLYPGETDVKLAIKSLEVIGDSNVAYFHGTVEVTIDHAKKDAMRVAGIAQHAPADWKLGAIMFASPVPDARTQENARALNLQIPKSGEAKLDGQVPVARVFQSWIDDKQLGSRREAHALAIAGTQASELRTGKEVAAMAAEFDKLGMKASSVDARLFFGYAWVTAEVRLPAHAGAPVVPMIVGGVLTSSAGKDDDWHWVTLDFTATQGNWQGELPQPYDATTDITIAHRAQGPFKDIAAWCATQPTESRRGTPLTCNEGKPPMTGTLQLGASGPFKSVHVFPAASNCMIALETAAGTFVRDLPTVCMDKNAMEQLVIQDGRLVARWKRSLDLAVGGMGSYTETDEVEVVCGIGASGIPSCTLDILVSLIENQNGAKNGGAVSVTVTSAA